MSSTAYKEEKIKRPYSKENKTKNYNIFNI